jgi:hypothetical protein
MTSNNYHNHKHTLRAETWITFTAGRGVEKTSPHVFLVLCRLLCAACTCSCCEEICLMGGTVDWVSGMLTPLVLLVLRKTCFGMSSDSFSYEPIIWKEKIRRNLISNWWYVLVTSCEFENHLSRREHIPGVWLYIPSCRNWCICRHVVCRFSDKVVLLGDWCSRRHVCRFSDIVAWLDRYWLVNLWKDTNIHI